MGMEEANRVRQIKEYVDKMLVILPFEKSLSPLEFRGGIRRPSPGGVIDRFLADERLHAMANPLPYYRHFFRPLIALSPAPAARDLEKAPSHAGSMPPFPRLLVRGSQSPGAGR